MKKIHVLALAAVMAVSMNAFAGSAEKSCPKKDAKTCELKEAHCKESGTCEKTKCNKPCEKKKTS